MLVDDRAAKSLPEFFLSITSYLEGIAGDSSKSCLLGSV